MKTTRHTRDVIIAIVTITLGGIIWLWGRSAGRDEAQRLGEMRDGHHELVAHDTLDPTVRMLLHGRMRRHGDTAERLWRAFLSADYNAIAANAEELAAEPSFRQPAPGEDPALLNGVIPPELFTYQSDLERAASALARAASAGDARAVDEAFHQTIASCFACHRRYRAGADGPDGKSGTR